MTAEVIARRALDMQVCVPDDWTDEQVKRFADQDNPCGTEFGWDIRKQGDALLGGDNERVACEQKAGHVHIVLDA